MIRMNRQVDDNRAERVEQLLRRQGGTALSPNFRRNVMAAVSRLPEPQVYAAARPRDLLYALRLLTTGERIGLGLALCAVVALLLPGAGDLFALAELELSDFTVDLSVGGVALSASLLSVIAVTLGVLFMAGVGAFASRNHLIGA